MNEPHPIRALRNSRGLTQEDLAKLLGTTAMSVSRWETGEHLPQSKARAKLQEMGIKPSDLIQNLRTVAA